MTRFVYVLPAGRFRWEVRVDPFLPRPARSLDDLAVGQVVAWLEPTEGWMVMEVDLDGDELSWEFTGTEVIITDPTPHPPSLFYRRKAHALIAARAIAIVIGGDPTTVGAGYKTPTATAGTAHGGGGNGIPQTALQRSDARRNPHTGKPARHGPRGITAV